MLATRARSPSRSGRAAVVSGAPTRRPRKLTRRAREEFLEALAAGWSVTSAATAAGFSRQRFYELRESDEAFASAWQEAFEAGTDVLRDEVRRRAVDGVDEPVFRASGLVGHVRRFSDVLLIFELKRRDPSYRDGARVELTGAGGGPIELSHRDGLTLADVAAFVRASIDPADIVDGEAVEVRELEGAP